MGNSVLIETSARHVHVTEADLIKLFGEGATLTVWSKTKSINCSWFNQTPRSFNLRWFNKCSRPGNRGQTS